MDKLKPILNQKFWILFAVALLLPVIGWFLGTGALAASIKTREDKLNGLSVPDGTQIPNETWVNGAQEIADERQKRLETAGSFLWDQQQKYMTWPAGVGREVAGKPFGSDISNSGLNRYRFAFDIVADEVWKTADPIRPDDVMRPTKYIGKVQFPREALPLSDQRTLWPMGAPTAPEVWYLQEDAWLLRSLLEAVNDINTRAGADSIIKAPIKQIVSLQLQGGDRASLDAAAEGAGEAGAGGGTDSSGMDSSGMSSSGGGMASAMAGMYGGEGGAAAGGVDFNLAEEVGVAAPAASAEGTSSESGEASSDATTSGGLSSGMLSAMSGGMSGAMGGATGAAALLTEDRYVDDDPALPFKTRAFKMTVVMDHRQLPEFLVRLTNSPFPVNILRVHWVEMNPDPTFAGSGSSGGGYSGGEGRMGPGMGGMSAMPGSGGGGHSGPGGMSRPSGGFGMGGRPPMGMPMPGSGGGGHSGPGGMSRPGGLSGMGRPPMGMPMPGSGGGGHGGPGGMSRPPMGMPMPMGSSGGPRFGSGMSGEGYEGGMAGEAGGGDLVAQAMSNPYLAEVVIGGLMTIYRSPEEIKAGAEGGEQPAETPATEQPATDAAAPAEGDAAQPPAEGTPPAEGATPAEGTTPANGTPPADGTNPAAPADATTPATGGTAPAGTTPGGTATPDAGANGTPPPAAPDGAQPPNDAAPNGTTAPPAGTAADAAAAPAPGTGQAPPQ